MSRKRRLFDIDMPAMDDIPVEKIPDKALERRRSPMAAAISENADTLRDQIPTEDAIRAENDRLAHEYVRLKAEGLIVQEIALDDVVSEKLTRDRKPGDDPDLEELKLSIQDIGLSNPIRVERRTDGRFELIQGMRRLTAYRALQAQTGEARFAKIPAGISGSAETPDSYRRMVDENLIRKDISFAEMGALALSYAADPLNDCPDVDKAVAALFKSASYTKRSYIRAFASLIARLEKVLNFPKDIPRNVGVELKRRLDADPDLVGRVSSALRAEPDRDAGREIDILRSFGAGEGTTKTTPQSVSGRPRKAKTTFQVSSEAGLAKCTASNGRMELRCDLDFTRVDRSQLEAAIAQMLAELQDD